MQDKRAVEETPVLIVGGGPIGLALAADLGRRGIAAILIEKNDDRLGSPKMLEVSIRTMEFCRQLGIADQVRNWGFPLDHPLDSIFVTSLQGHEIGRVVTPSLGEVSGSKYSPERTRPCPQTWFDPIVQKSARAWPHISLRYGIELKEFVQDSDGVTATAFNRRTGQNEIFRARYLVGCDGFQSTVRDLLGIEVRGDRHIDWSLTIYLRAPDFHARHDKGRAFRYVFVGPEGTWSFLSAINGQDLWRLQLIGLDREALQDTDIPAALRRCMGQDFDYTVEDRNLWVRKRTVADRFMDGRVFIAGDAAHAHPPNGGLGMNTGIQDSFDLGWKIAAVLNGWGGANLLESYDYERRPASARATEVSLKNFKRLTDDSRDAEIDAPGAKGDAIRRRIGRQLVEANEKVWHPIGVHLGYIYNPSPIVVPDGSPRPSDDTFSYEPSAFPGARAPHLWLDAETSILDLFGDGFTLLSFADAPTEAIEQAARLRRVPLTRHRIAHRDAARLYGKALVLVRPDGHVAWRGDCAPEDPVAMIDRVRGARPTIAARRTED